jgi:hypothetical protein
MHHENSKESKNPDKEKEVWAEKNIIGHKKSI